MLSESQGFNSVAEQHSTAVSIFGFSNISSYRRLKRPLCVNYVLGVRLAVELDEAHQKRGHGHQLTWKGTCIMENKWYFRTKWPLIIV